MSANELQPDSQAATPELVTVALGVRSYDIVVGTNLLEQSGDLIAPLLTLPRTILISDETVAPLYAERTINSLSHHGVTCETIVLKPGEVS